MPLPAMAVLGALALGALMLSSKSKAAPTSTRPLDAGIPPGVDQQIKEALATVTDPATLEAMAIATDQAGYKNSSAALRARAAQLRGQINVPGVPMPDAPRATSPAGVGPLVAPPVASVPQVVPPGLGGPVPPPPPPPPPPAAPPNIEDLDLNIPPALANAVAALLSKPDLTDQELAYTDQLATTLDSSGYPRAAAKLRARALAIRAQHAGASLLGQINNILTTPPGQLPPFPTAPLPGIPPLVPIPGVAPQAPVPVPVPVAPTASAAPGVAPPVAPLARTYKVARGDNPSTIAQRFTGSPQNFRQLAAANPDKSSRILSGKIFEGETLTLPDSWPAVPTHPAPAPTPLAPVTPAAPGALHATIRQGSNGADVALWQTIIGVTADGAFGPQTDAATRTWQSQHGVTPDGVVGPQTWAAALAGRAPADAPSVIPAVAIAPAGIPSVHAMIRQGSSGPDVVAWQKIIGVTADGAFGPQTAAATRTWQSQHGLTADGVVGPQTWAAALASQSAAAGALAPYVVQAGDTPFTIAQRFTGDGRNMLQLADVNPAAAARIRNGLVMQGEALNLPSHWNPAATAAGTDSWTPAAVAGVMEIIGAHHAPGDRGNGTLGDHGRA